MATPTDRVIEAKEDLSYAHRELAVKSSIVEGDIKVIQAKLSGVEQSIHRIEGTLREYIISLERKDDDLTSTINTNSFAQDRKYNDLKDDLKTKISDLKDDLKTKLIEQKEYTADLISAVKKESNGTCSNISSELTCQKEEFTKVTHALEGVLIQQKGECDKTIQHCKDEFYSIKSNIEEKIRTGDNLFNWWLAWGQGATAVISLTITGIGWLLHSNTVEFHISNSDIERSLKKYEARISELENSISQLQLEISIKSKKSDKEHAQDSDNIASKP